jgi:hypothetical protein
MMFTHKIVIPRSRSLIFDSEVKVLRPSDIMLPWLLVIFGELKITKLAMVIFSQGKVVLSSEGSMILDGIAAFEYLSLGLEYPANDVIKEPSNNTCVRGSGKFLSLLLRNTDYKAARLKIFCDISTNISFSMQRNAQNTIQGDIHQGYEFLQPYLSTDLTLLVGMQHFTVKFETTQQYIIGYVVTIQNLVTDRVLDLQMINLDVTNLNLVGWIKITNVDGYVHRLQILGGVPGLELQKGEFCVCNYI